MYIFVLCVQFPVILSGMHIPVFFLKKKTFFKVKTYVAGGGVVMADGVEECVKLAELLQVRTSLSHNLRNLYEIK